MILALDGGIDVTCRRGTAEKAGETCECAELHATSGPCVRLLSFGLFWPVLSCPVLSCPAQSQPCCRGALQPPAPDCTGLPPRPRPARRLRWLAPAPDELLFSPRTRYLVYRVPSRGPVYCVPGALACGSTQPSTPASTPLHSSPLHFHPGPPHSRCRPPEHPARPFLSRACSTPPPAAHPSQRSTASPIPLRATCDRPAERRSFLRAHVGSDAAIAAHD